MKVHAPNGFDVLVSLSSIHYCSFWDDRVCVMASGALKLCKQLLKPNGQLRLTISHHDGSGGSIGFYGIVTANFDAKHTPIDVQKTCYANDCEKSKFEAYANLWQSKIALIGAQQVSGVAISTWPRIPSRGKWKDGSAAIDAQLQAEWKSQTNDGDTTTSLQEFSKNWFQREAAKERIMRELVRARNAPTYKHLFCMDILVQLTWLG